MKTLVVYYSRTGNTRKVAGEIAEALGAELDEIKEKKDRSGALGYMQAGKDAMMGKGAEIGEGKDAGGYGMVVVGTPIWAFTVAPPVREYLDRNKGKIEKVAFFCTQAGKGSEKAFGEMEKICGKEPVGVLVVSEKEIADGEHARKAREFAGKIGAE
jgi:flavodoxin